MTHNSREICQPMTCHSFLPSNTLAHSTTWLSHWMLLLALLIATPLYLSATAWLDGQSRGLTMWSSRIFWKTIPGHSSSLTLHTLVQAPIRLLFSLINIDHGATCQTSLTKLLVLACMVSQQLWLTHAVPSDPWMRTSVPDGPSLPLSCPWSETISMRPTETPHLDRDLRPTTLSHGMHRRISLSLLMLL